MKLKLIFLALLFSPLLSIGQQLTGNLTIFSESGDKFYLVLNGEQQNDVPQTNVRIEDLNQPYYSTRIIFEDNRISDIVKNLQVTDMTGAYMDVTYKIQRAGARVELNYFSMAPVRQKYVAPKNMYVMHYGRHKGDYRDHGGYNDRDRDNDSDYGRDGDRDHGRNRDRYRHHDDQPQIYPMNDADFAQAKEAVRKAAFKDDMLSTAKSILSNNWLTTDQVIAMCKVFSFDDTKLDFTKAAYFRTTDPASYFKVANVFAFSSDKEDLNNFIASNRNTNTNNNSNNNNGRHNRHTDPVAMDNGSFADAKQTIKNGSFESTMLSTAKGIISNNYFTTDQVMELVKLFAFDEAKLDIAKTAYLRTLDRNNYFKVGNALTFSSSKEDLNNFLAGQH